MEEVEEVPLVLDRARQVRRCLEKAKVEEGVGITDNLN